METYTVRGRRVQIGRAPKGGLVFGDRHYRGGQFCPIAALPVCGGAPEEAETETPTVEVDLKRERDTWGNYGQFDETTDYVQVGDQFLKCDDLPGASVTDRSAHSAKNEHTKITVKVALPIGTIGKTFEADASSRNRSSVLNYWRVVEGGGPEDGDPYRYYLGHKVRKVTEGKIDLVYHDLENGVSILARRAPHGVRTNSFPGKCACGAKVPAESGKLFRTTSGQWATQCVDCFAKQD